MYSSRDFNAYECEYLLTPLLKPKLSIKVYMSGGKSTQILSDQLNIFSQSEHTHVLLDQERKLSQPLMGHEALTMRLLVNRYSGLLLI